MYLKPTRDSNAARLHYRHLFLNICISRFIFIRLEVVIGRCSEKFHKIHRKTLAMELFYWYNFMLSGQQFCETLANDCFYTSILFQPSEKEEGAFQTLAQEFLLNWSFFTAKVIQELTLKSAKSFGRFQSRP